MKFVWLKSSATRAFSAKVREILLYVIEIESANIFSIEARSNHGGQRRMSAELKERIKDSAGKQPGDAATAKSHTQPFITSLLKALNKEITPCTSISDPAAYRKVSYGTRRPDIVFHLKDHAGSGAITMIGDVKGRSGTSDFNDEQMGHIIDMTFDLLQYTMDYCGHIPLRG